MKQGSAAPAHYNLGAASPEEHRQRDELQRGANGTIARGSSTFRYRTSNGGTEFGALG